MYTRYLEIYITLARTIGLLKYIYICISCTNISLQDIHIYIYFNNPIVLANVIYISR